MANKAKQFDVKALRQKALQDDVIYDSFYVKEWDAELPIKTLTAPAMKKIMANRKDEIRMMILAVLYGCATKEGERVFEETDLAKFEGEEKSLAPILALGGKILEISGMSEEAEKSAKNG
jgi:hypothetical protein